MKPSKIKSVKAKTTSFLLRGFSAITWMGVIYCKHFEDAALINKADTIDSVFECHETIHVKQAESCHDSWLLFYLEYVWQYFKNIPLLFVELRIPYYFIAFELEAYAFEDNFSYPHEKCTKWKTFDKLTLKEKFRMAKEYKNKGYMTTSAFINTKIIPYINEKRGALN